MAPNVRDFMPISFAEVLDRLASWEGQHVRVASYALAPGHPQSHTMTVFAGALGRLQMVDNMIDAGSDGVAGFSVGPTEPNGFYLSRDSFRRAQPLPTIDGSESIRIDFDHAYAIQVDWLG